MATQIAGGAGGDGQGPFINYTSDVLKKSGGKLRRNKACDACKKHRGRVR